MQTVILQVNKVVQVIVVEMENAKLITLANVTPVTSVQAVKPSSNAETVTQKDNVVSGVNPVQTPHTGPS